MIEADFVEEISKTITNAKDDKPVWLGDFIHEKGDYLIFALTKEQAKDLFDE